jgi:hypothetical protein
MIRTRCDAAFVLVLAVPCLAQGTDWEPVGQAAFSAAHVTSCRIAFDRDDVPYVAYQDLSPGARTSVKRFVAGGWEYVGAQGGASIGTAWYNQMRFDAEDNLYVATRDYGVGGRVNVRAFLAGATSWGPVGIGIISPGEAHYTSIALRPDGTPCIAFADRATSVPDRASAMSFEGGTWGFLGSEGLSPSSAGYTSIAVDGAGVPYVGFSDGSCLDASNVGKGTVMRYDASNDAWQLVGPQGFTAVGALNATVSIDRAGTPWFAYHHYHSKIVVLKYDGAQWAPVGLSASGPDRPDVATEGWRQWLSLCFDSQNTPYVAYQRWDFGSKAAVRRFDGSTWAPVGRLGFTPAAADYLALAIDSKDVPYVVYRDAANSGGVSVMRFAPSPSVYCTAKTSSHGCEAEIAVEGNASLSSSLPCLVGASEVITHKTGVLLLGSAPAHTPFFGGHLCLDGTIVRTPPQNSGGAQGVDDCSGSYALDLNPLLQADGAGFAAGQMLFAQYWYRDPLDSFLVGLSNAARVTIAP